MIAAAPETGTAMVVRSRTKDEQDARTRSGRLAGIAAKIHLEVNRLSMNQGVEMWLSGLIGPDEWIMDLYREAGAPFGDSLNGSALWAMRKGMEGRTLDGADMTQLLALIRLEETVARAREFGVEI